GIQSGVRCDAGRLDRCHRHREGSRRAPRSGEAGGADEPQEAALGSVAVSCARDATATDPGNEETKETAGRLTSERLPSSRPSGMAPRESTPRLTPGPC